MYMHVMYVSHVYTVHIIALQQLTLSSLIGMWLKV